jgi:DNA polymerase-3 subunit gamma/tau
MILLVEPMSYKVLARKYRPHTFSEVMGQEHVVRVLVHALDHDRVHHAFLFTGTRGIGKTTIARILAKSLNCEQGVGSQPCGVCQACVELDEGRFVDLIEVDAASRTKVDDTRELLENVQYAPMRGRFKVYLIDEVHMLSGHSFNALLKTLEEPPPHVKFLLATTDPQKLPVTVLSRCLQFNLKKLLPDLIQPQLQKILKAEAIPYDAAALTLLARAADGSMRDALSLLDQAIAYSGGTVDESQVREMLGSIDQAAIARLLGALSTGDAQALVSVVAEISEHGVDHDTVLSELLLSLHQISLAQVDEGLLNSVNEDKETILANARSMTPEDVQLYYQIGIVGRRDLPFAPDARTGLEMVLLRMLAFRPPTDVGAKRELQTPAKVGTSDTIVGSVASSEPQVSPSDWGGVVERLKVDGFVREMAHNSTIESLAKGDMVLVLDESCAQLYNKEREAALRDALEEFYGTGMRLSIRVSRPNGETPAQKHSRMEDTRQKAAADAIYNDPNVKALEERFDARVNPASIRPKS